MGCFSHLFSNKNALLIYIGSAFNLTILIAYGESQTADLW